MPMGFVLLASFSYEWLRHYVCLSLSSPCLGLPLVGALDSWSLRLRWNGSQYISNSHRKMARLKDYVGKFASLSKGGMVFSANVLSMVVAQKYN